jgi:hypothetical protein
MNEKDIASEKIKDIINERVKNWFASAKREVAFLLAYITDPPTPLNTPGAIMIDHKGLMQDIAAEATGPE